MFEQTDDVQPKRQHITLQRNDDCRARFMAEVSVYNPAMLVWVDESGCDKRNCVRKQAYSIRGLNHEGFVVHQVA